MHMRMHMRMHTRMHIHMHTPTHTHTHACSRGEDGIDDVGAAGPFESRTR